MNRYVPNSAESFLTMTTCIEKVRAHEATLPAEPQPEGESKSDNNNNANANADDMAMDTTEDLPQPPAPTTVLPEVEVFLCTLCVTTLLRYGLHTEAAWAASNWTRPRFCARCPGTGMTVPSTGVEKRAASYLRA